MIASIERWLYGSSGREPQIDVCRVVNVGDVLATVKRVEALGLRTEVVRYDPILVADGTAVDLNDTNNGDLECFKLNVYDEVDAEALTQVATVQVGRRTAYRRDMIPNALTPELTAALADALAELERSGRRAVQPRRWRILADATFTAVLLGLWFWCAAAVWTSWPERVLTLALVPMIRRAVLTSIREYSSRHSRYLLHTHVVVRPMTRDEWRRKRWENRRDWKVLAMGIASGAGATLVTGLISGWFDVAL